MNYLGQAQNLDWTSASRIFATTVELFDSQPNYENEVAIALDTRTKYRGIAPVVGGWGFATGAPSPVVPPSPPAVNDGFTKSLLQFEGIERSTTYPDTNVAVWPRTWKSQGGFGGVTNVGELFDGGALYLDGNTILVAPDETRFDLKDFDFTVRGHFLCDIPMGERRTLVAKSDNFPAKFVFWCDRLADGRFDCGVDTIEIVDHTILDRFGSQIIDRQGEFVISRFDAPASGFVGLTSTTIYTDAVNTGWHKFEMTRAGPSLRLRMDDVQEATTSIGGQVVNQLPGPLIIGAYALPREGVVQAPPWRGMVDRLAIDIGIAR